LHALLKTKNRASPHKKDRRGKMVVVPQYSKGYYAVAPAGGINSSVQDMTNFLKMHMGGNPDLVSKRMLEMTYEPQIETQEVAHWGSMPKGIVKHAHYGLGWRVIDFAGEKIVFHGGWVNGFTNVIAFMPKRQIGIVILQNAETRFSWKMAVKFFELYLGLKK
jgi:beta-lactamase class C